MPKRSVSANRLRTSSGARKPKLSKLARHIIEGLEEGAAFMRGEITLPVRHYPDPVDVKAVRAKSGLSQSEFAGRYGFNARTLQEWEQGRTQPDSAVRAYLTVIARNPKAVEEALSGR
jgi:putative transcriptional regulator